MHMCLNPKYMHNYDGTTENNCGTIFGRGLSCLLSGSAGYLLQLFHALCRPIDHLNHSSITCYHRLIIQISLSILKTSKQHIINCEWALVWYLFSIGWFSLLLLEDTHHNSPYSGWILSILHRFLTSSSSIAEARKNLRFCFTFHSQSLLLLKSSFIQIRHETFLKYRITAPLQETGEQIYPLSGSSTAIRRSMTHRKSLPLELFFFISSLFTHWHNLFCIW